MEKLGMNSCVINWKRCTLLLALGLLPQIGFAKNVEGKDDSWNIGFVLENDLTANTDSNYTSGVRLSLISPDLTHFSDSEVLPDWSHSSVDILAISKEPEWKRNIGFGLGQKIFTPEDILSSKLIEDDRPYAGWLYTAITFYSKNANTLDTMELQLGVIGPAALGREAQNSVHRIRGLKEAKGWSHQLNNEFGILFLYERKWRALEATHENGLGTDLITHGGATVGNVLTFANMGAEWRFGWHLPTDFGTSLIRPGGDSTGPTNVNDSRFADHIPFGIYAFGAVTGRVMLRDIFLDGNTFSNSHSVNKEYFVGDFIIGGSVIIQGVRLTYAQVFRGKEFEEQRSGSSFGSFSASYSF